MEDYIQGVVCGYLTVQNGTRDDAKRKRMFVVLSDSRMDYYLTDPRPEFKESITESYVFTDKTQAHYYAEMNPRAPLNSICLTADKMTDVYIAESASEADGWLKHLRERLEALHQVVVGTLMVRRELSVTQQVQRALLQTKYKWRQKHVELGRSTIRFCGTNPNRPQKRAMNQFTLTAESYASEEPVEVLKSVALAGFSVSTGALSASDLKKIQKDVRLQATLGSGKGTSGLVYPFIVCTGPAHLHIAAATEKERDEWIVAIKLRIIALKYRHNGRQATSQQGDSFKGLNVRMHDFMEVQSTPGGPWKRRYVELENEMLKVKLNDRTLGSKFETRLLPSCCVTTSLLKANAFVVQNLGQEISLAPGTLKDSQGWMKAIKDVAYNVSLARCYKVFADDLASLLAHSVVYNITVAGDGANAGFVVEKHKKRIFVLSHQPPTTANAEPVVRVPEGSVLLGISHVGMVHDSFETIWHKLRQKKSFQNTMRLTFRAPMYKESLVDVKFKPKERWVLRRCTMRNGRLRIEPALPPENSDADRAESTEMQQTTASATLEVALRDCCVELLTFDELNVRNTLKISVATSQHKAIFFRVHHDQDLFAWFALLALECGVAQDDTRFPLTLNTLKKLKQGTPSPLGYVEDQKKQTGKCKIAGQALIEIEHSAKALEAKLLQRARVEQQQLLREDPSLLSPDSPLTLSQVDLTAAFGGRTTAALGDDEIRQLFQHLDAIGCGKISSSAVASTMESLTRQLDPQDRAKVMEPVNSALSKLVPASRQFVSITLEQTIDVLHNVTDPRVIELVRKFSRHEIQCM